MATERAQKILDQLKQKWNQENKPADISNLDLKAIEAARDLDSIQPQKDYMALVREYQAKHGVDICTAMRATEKRYPHKLREYIKKHNPGKNID